jgi:hypothetical protein
MRRGSWFAGLLLGTLAAISTVGQARAESSPAPERFDALFQLIAPGADEAGWTRVSWMPSQDIWRARQKAAAEGKPIFLWYMAGEPLGPC